MKRHVLVEEKREEACAELNVVVQMIDRILEGSWLLGYLMKNK